MVAVISKPDTQRKLEILSADAQYDLACACGTSQDEGRRRGQDGRWIYPVILPNGGRSVLLKTLISNVCCNDCKYCPLREQQDVRRCSLGPEETARVFLDYYQQKKVFGLFLSSGVIGSPDATMDRLTATARLLRRKRHFRGYIHLKVIPGASDAAIEEAVSLASAVSLNIETPGAANLARLSNRKDYIRDIIEPIKLISRLTARGTRFARVKQTTQFIVGAAGEADDEIVKYMGGLYERLKLQRIYFSAYQKGSGDASLAAEHSDASDPAQTFTREHRLYQVDFLMRKYGFKDADIIFDSQGRLVLEADPKEVWARNHPEFFPLNVNRASRLELLRVPGLGPITVDWILKGRRGQRMRRLEDLGRPGVRLSKAGAYLAF
ncbi:MAG: radical SAM protein [Phycisphaerales bacterium]|nr:MAG: radical SAM protein [Phycisphaerales bacterium]